MTNTTASFYLAVGTQDKAEKLKNCKSQNIEDAKKEADRELKKIRSRGDMTTLVRVVNTFSRIVEYIAGLPEIKSKFVTEFGSLQNATRYAFCDDLGNEATFTPQETLEIFDFLLEKAQRIKKERDRLKPEYTTLSMLIAQELGLDISRARLINDGSIFLVDGIHFCYHDDIGSDEKESIKFYAKHFRKDYPQYDTRILKIEDEIQRLTAQSIKMQERLAFLNTQLDTVEQEREKELSTCPYCDKPNVTISHIENCPARSK